MPTSRELTVLASIAEALNSAPDVQHALERTLELVANLLGLDVGWVWLVDRESGHIYSAAARNLPPYLQEPVRMSGSWCWCIEQFRQGALTASNVDIMECSRLRPAVRRHETELTHGLAHHATIPLYFQDKPLGIMNVTAPAMRRLTKDELRLLSTIGLQTGVAVERARLAEERAILARADERGRLAREIHDTLAQGLTALALQIETALQNLESDPKKARERMEKALATARTNLDEARRSVTNLRAEPLAGKPLAQALAALVREFISESGIRATLEVRESRVASRRSAGPDSRLATSDSPSCPLSLASEAELYRIAEQALANVKQHAHAKTVAMTLRCTRRSAALTIADDGGGFDVRRIPDGRHGITGMRERARIAGGTLRIVSGAQGTTITAKVPRS